MTPEEKDIFEAYQKTEFIIAKTKNAYMRFMAAGEFLDCEDLPPVSLAREIIGTLQDTWYFHELVGLTRMTRMTIVYHGDQWNGEVWDEQKIWHTVADNKQLAAEICYDYVSEWYMWVAGNFPFAVREFKRKRDRQQNLVLNNHSLLRRLKDKLDAKNCDIVGSTEVAEMIDKDANVAGKMMRSLGYRRKRMAGSGTNQYAWFIRNADKYEKMRPRKIRAEYQRSLISFL
jgi:hypothetical protein